MSFFVLFKRQSIGALILVIIAEMATVAFIYVAHDKASNRNKNKNFDRDLKLLCDLASFCIQPMLLIITGTFLCVSIVLQVMLISLFCPSLIFATILLLTCRLAPSRYRIV